MCFNCSDCVLFQCVPYNTVDQRKKCCWLPCYCLFSSGQICSVLCCCSHPQRLGVTEIHFCTSNNLRKHYFNLVNQRSAWLQSKIKLSTRFLRTVEHLMTSSCWATLPTAFVLHPYLFFMFSIMIQVAASCVSESKNDLSCFVQVISSTRSGACGTMTSQRCL